MGEPPEMANLRQMQNMLFQAPDMGGQRVDVKSVDPAKIKYLYDFSSIFANPQQEGMFLSPFAEGGQVEINDELLRFFGDK